jgi:integrase
VDRRRVVNPAQARRLLAAVREQGPTGRRLVAFFGSMYYSAFRPEEVVSLREDDLSYGKRGWGEFYVSRPAPEVGSDWTDSGKTREERGQLKHRAEGDGRWVPCPPPLTRLIRAHVAEFGTGEGGLLFTGPTGGEVASSTYGRIWDKARKAALSPAEYRSPLAKRPYDLRHACVSTWLNGGVAPAQVAEWAGHFEVDDASDDEDVDASDDEGEDQP